jgi:hypothetical protein
VGTIVDVGGRNPPDLHTFPKTMDKRDPMPPGEAIALTGGIKQTQCVRIIAYHHGDRVVIKHLSKRLKFSPSKHMGGLFSPLERIRWGTCSSCMKLGDRSSSQYEVSFLEV